MAMSPNQILKKKKKKKRNQNPNYPNGPKSKRKHMEEGEWERWWGSEAVSVVV